MESRESRKDIALDTLKICELGFFENSEGKKVWVNEAQKYAEEYTKVYSPESSDKLITEIEFEQFAEPANIEVNNKTTMDAARNLIEQGHSDIVILNFASAKNPGGGFLGGSQAQEESIARSTGLYNCLLKAKAYYEINRKIKSCFYTDYMIYSPNVPIFKDEKGNNISELQTISIITAPAVNTGIVKQRERKKIDQIEPVMKRRIAKVLSIALNHGHKVIVLGAWGCGVFQNDPVEIARYFKEVIEERFRYAFKKIVFAIYAKNTRFIEPFYKEFY